MNITVLANRDLASNLALNHLLPSLVRDHEVHVFLSSQVGSSTVAPYELQQLKFFEQGLFNQLLFPALQGSSLNARLLSFDALARVVGVPSIGDLNKINTEEGLQSLAATAPDLVLSIRYGGILKDQAIAIPSHGVLNLHSGLLPDYRGVMATFYAMLNGESEIGTTLHTILDAGIDTGDIVGSTRVRLNTGHSYLWNVLQLYPAGVEQMLACVEEISSGQVVACKPQPKGGNYYSFPSEQELRRFTEMGYRLYDVDESISIAKQYMEI